MVRYRVAALVASAAMIFAACSGSATPSPSESAAPPSEAPSAAVPSAAESAPASPAAATPKEGGTLIAGLPGDMVLADPSLVSDSNSSEIEAQVIQGLVGLQPGTNSVLIPVLASALPTISPDGLTFTFTLLQGVKFHDGTDFNADAVVFSLGRQFKKDNPAYNFGPWQYWGGMDMDNIINDVVKVDDATVQITLKKKEAPFLANLARFSLATPISMDFTAQFPPCRFAACCAS